VLAKASHETSRPLKRFDTAHHYYCKDRLHYGMCREMFDIANGGSDGNLSDYDLRRGPNNYRSKRRAAGE
jgi:hypothetical protein